MQTAPKPNGHLTPALGAPTTYQEPEPAPVVELAPAPEKEPSLWALIPARYRPWVLAVLVLGGSGSGAAFANLRAIWTVPDRVGALEAQVKANGEKIDALTAAIRGMTDRGDK